MIDLLIDAYLLGGLLFGLTHQESIEKAAILSGAESECDFIDRA